MKKTNAMRILDSNKINYEEIAYETDGSFKSGVNTANKLNEDVNHVYKTLVTKSNTKNIFVFVIPAPCELDMKKAAFFADEKSIEMIEVKELKNITGYVRGGCSPIGMKKDFPVFLDKSALNLSYIYISGGKIGFQIKLNPKDLIKLTNAKVEDIIR
ncbi:MAG: Cys-tRNA(Pro) deacylase [Peptoniphilaceae bacterium]|nr:Cys-tRNA(Pro) deacylase [Peptoniphilaceae bacterium]MDD7382980.1 Cys-tRNA(Pro) deacylase [Peptoniphilaceae bacterium]MDY3737731.1 Cys-tRNA(Pro) deacylase [Peptoniphilaceae bacterium]